MSNTLLVEDVIAESEEPVEASWWLQPGVVVPVLCSVNPDGEFVGTVTADPSPLEPGTWLLPAHSYAIELPEIQDGFAPVIGLNGAIWQQVEDHRGATVYSTQTREAQVWQTLGALPIDLTLQEPNTQFDVWVDGGWKVDQAAQNAVLYQNMLHKRDLLSQFASYRINPLQDAVDLNLATDDEQTALKAWKEYRIDLARLQLDAKSSPIDTWPLSPDEPALLDWLSKQRIEPAEFSE
ncbi:tail fiber assembly protein [Pseudomonas sp. NPDC090233]|uniref:tail fiber assembly protein n=1 Tax=Pseudomonas sp. NPDC090233 TaxID=3364479 RepID=UPI00383B056A